MFRNIKLGTKIVLGFGAIIMISVAVFGLGIYNMKNVQRQSNQLSQEYVPETDIAVALERATLRTMYAMRGYAFTEEQEYLDTGRKSMEEVKKQTDEGRQLATRYPGLVKLNEELQKGDAMFGQYRQLVDQTVASNQKLAENRKALDANAKKYMAACTAYLAGQDEAMSREIAEKADPAKLKERQEKIRLVNEIVDLGNSCRIAVWRSQAEREPKVIQDAMKNFDEMRPMFEAVRKLTRLEADLKQVDDTQESANGYKTAMNDLLANWLVLQDVSKKRGVIGDEILATAERIDTAGIENTRNLAVVAADSLATASSITIVGSIVAVVVAVLLAVFITRSITRPIRRVIEGLNEGADQVNDAAGQVSGASQQLAEGASEQASSLEETSSALEEMAAMTRTNASNAKEANGLAGQAREAANDGDKSMVQLNEAMAGINTSSEKISKIIKVIEEIAFQTNLLALNAAVEAARAGEHGKGFAVVADEVRNLAQRCAQAAKETTGLIEDAVHRAQQGTQVATEVGKSLSAIVGQVTKVSDLINGISKASDEQAQGVDQVNTAVSQMDKVTQQNASGAEESASAAEELAAQAQAVKAMVGELVTMVGGAGERSGNRASTGHLARKSGGAHPGRASSVAHGSLGKSKSTTHANERGVDECLVIGDDSDLKKF